MSELLGSMNSNTEALDGPALMHAIAVDRDRTALARIATVYRGRLQGFLRQRGLGDADAEELSQQVLVRVWQRADQFDAAHGGLSAWLFRIARNLHIDWQRRLGTQQRAAPLLEASEETSTPGPEIAHAETSRAERVQAALAQLPERQRQVVHMAFYQAKTHGEIAAELDMPLGSVKSTLRLAFNKLRSSMEDAP